MGLKLLLLPELLLWLEDPSAMKLEESLSPGHMRVPQVVRSWRHGGGARVREEAGGGCGRKLIW